MEKKEGVLILTTLFVLFSLAYLVTGGLTVGTIPDQTNVTINSSDGVRTATAAASAETRIFAFHIYNAGPDEIMNITITLPNNTIVAANDSTTTTNYTGGDASGNLTFYNLGAGTIVWAVGNETADGLTTGNANVSNISVGENLTLNVELTMPVVASDTTINFTIAIYDNTSELSNFSAAMTVYTPTAPTISEINVTDGAREVSTFDGSDYMQYNRPLNISFTVTDTLVVNLTNVTVILNNASQSYVDGSTEVREPTSDLYILNATTADTKSPYRFNATIPAGFVATIGNYTGFGIIIHNEAYNTTDFEHVSGFYNFTLNDSGTTPTYSELNMSDGVKSTTNLTGSDFFMAGRDLNISVVLTDTFLESANVTLYFNVSKSNQTLTTANVRARVNTTLNMTTTDTASPYRFNATLKMGGFQKADYVQFILIANDKYYNVTDYELIGGTFNFSVNDTGNIPTISGINVTEGTNSISSLDGGSELIANTVANYTVSLVLTGADVDTTNVTLLYNSSNITSSAAWPIDGPVRSTSVAGMDLNMSTTDTSSPYRFNVTIPLDTFDSNNTVKVSFAVIAPNLYYNETDYELVAGSYNFTLDGTPPSSTLTAPSVTAINNQESIVYQCTGGDASTCALKLEREGNLVTDYTAVACGADYTFSGSQTLTSGTYTVSCRVTDNVGKQSEIKTGTFTVSTASGDSTTSSGGGSSGSGTTTTTTEDDTTPSDTGFDIDFSKVETGTVSVSNGGSSSFTFEGGVKHTVEVKAVMGKQVRLVLSSEPVTLIISEGETKNVDLNADGEDDVSVTIDSIDENDKVKMTVKKLAGAVALAAEDAAAVAEVEGESGELEAPIEPPVYEAEKKAAVSRTVLIIVAVVVALLVILGFAFMKKKSGLS